MKVSSKNLREFVNELLTFEVEFLKTKPFPVSPELIRTLITINDPIVLHGFRAGRCPLKRSTRIFFAFSKYGNYWEATATATATPAACACIPTCIILSSASPCQRKAIRQRKSEEVNLGRNFLFFFFFISSEKLYREEEKIKSVARWKKKFKDGTNQKGKWFLLYGDLTNRNGIHVLRIRLKALFTGNINIIFA